MIFQSTVGRTVLTVAQTTGDQIWCFDFRSDYGSSNNTSRRPSHIRAIILLNLETE